MTVIVTILVLVFLVGVALGAYAWLAPRAVPVKRDLSAPKPPPPPAEPRTATADWTTQAGAEFSGLSESARCDLIFAVADLQDERSQQLLLHALEDPSEAVVLAAAHALARRGLTDAVQTYADEHPGERAERIVRTLALME
jgi:HEAT repeat protein